MPYPPLARGFLTGKYRRGAAGYRLNAAEMESLHKLTAYPKNWRPIWD
jgi:aryl-alcohol dehydrogenase-like predicted oxidoreductase